MRIAVIGRGTAGCLAASWISQLYPQHELFHVYDPRIPTIGVGEGTLPGLPETLIKITGLRPEEIESRLSATKKVGIQFEGWGDSGQPFTNHFYPRGKSFGYHLSAEYVVDLLEEYTCAACIPNLVTQIEPQDTVATLSFEDRADLTVDFVIDARGFPRLMDSHLHLELPFIPTNAALIRRTSSLSSLTVTRSIARPYGWVFVIPLQTHTSYGYIHDARLSERDEVEADFDLLLDEDGVSDYETRSFLHFPNFLCRQVYDGLVARVGNAAGFMEPLEATALALIEHQLNVILPYRLERPNSCVPRDAVVINRHLLRWAWRYGIFISWHYSRGSRYATPFWERAQQIACPDGLHDMNSETVSQGELDLFREFVAAGNALRVSAEQIPPPRLPSFAGFEVENFRDMAAGLVSV